MTFNLQQGTPLQPANQSYQSFDLTGNLTLKWPFEFLASTNVVANIMDFDQTAAFTVTLPNATLASPGQSFIVNNLSDFTLTITTFTGLTPFTIPAGKRWYFYLTSNDTDGTPNPDGVWETVVYGAGSSSPDANALCGLGLVVLPSLVTGLNVLNTNVITYVETSNFAVDLIHRASLIVVPTGGTLTAIELNANTLSAGFYFTVFNEGATLFSVTATGGTINTLADPLVVNAGAFYTLVYQGSKAWTAYGNDNNTSTQTTLYPIDVTDQGESIWVGLENASANIISIYGTLGHDTIIYLPYRTAEWIVYNQCDVSTYTLSIQAYTLPNSPVGTPKGLFTDQVVTFFTDPSFGDMEIATTQNPLYGNLVANKGSTASPGISFLTQNPPLVNSGTGMYGVSDNTSLGFSILGNSKATLDQAGLLAATQFQGINVPPGIASAPLGRAVINALVSSANQATWGGLGILQMDYDFDNTEQAGSVGGSLTWDNAISMTVTNANSRFLIIGSVAAGVSGDTATVRLRVDGATEVCMSQLSSNTNAMQNISVAYVHGPFTAGSSHTWDMRIVAGASGTPYINRSPTGAVSLAASSLFVFEIGGLA